MFDVNPQAQKLLELHAQALNTRAPHEPTWRDLSEYVYPQRTFNVSPGQRVGRNIYDGTPLWALTVLVNSLHYTLANSATIFYDLKTADAKKMSSFNVRKYLYNASRTMFDVLTSGDFHSAFHEMLIDLALFGNCCIYAEEDPDMVVSFSSRPLNEIAWMIRSNGKPDVVAREFKMTLRQLVDKFGVKALSERQLKSWNDTSLRHASDLYKVSHMTLPRSLAERTGYGQKSFPYASVYIDIESKKILEEGGYNEWPYGCGRWVVSSGESYGRGLGDSVLPDARQLHMVQKHTIRAVQKATDPALMLPDKMFIKDVRTSSGAFNYYRGFGNAAQDPNKAIAAFPSGSHFPVARDEKEDLRNSIARGFMVDQLRLANNDRMTRAEVMQRVQEGLQSHAPALGRLNSDVFVPIIARAFAICERRGLFGPVPQELQGQPLKIEFKNQLARSQRMADTQAMVGAFDAITPIANIDGSILKEVDNNKAMRFIWESFGAPMDCIRPPEEAAAEQKKARDEEAQTADLQKAQALSSSISDIAGATEKFAGAQRLRSGPQIA